MESKKKKNSTNSTKKKKSSNELSNHKETPPKKESSRPQSSSSATLVTTSTSRSTSTSAPMKKIMLEPPSMGKSFFIYGVAPLVMLWLLSLYGHYVVVPSKQNNPSSKTMTPEDTKNDAKKHVSANSVSIDDVRKHFDDAKAKDSAKPKKSVKKETNKKKKPVSARNPKATQLQRLVAQKREAYEENPTDVYKILELAEALQHHDEATYGAVHLAESIELYDEAKSILYSKRAEFQQMSGISMNELDQLDRLILAAEYGVARMYFQGNMFEKSIEACNNALKVKEDMYVVRNFRATSYTILGKYDKAAEDYIAMIENDPTQTLAPDAVTGLAKILTAKESIIPGGWDLLLDTVNGILPSATNRYEELVTLQEKNPSDTRQMAIKQACQPLRRMHYAMFNYYDQKTDDKDTAFSHLSKAAFYASTSSDTLPVDKDFAMQDMQVQNIKQIFNRQFFEANKGFGHPSKVPIFIIGFYRSGSTLTERVLDAHPDIVGTGEDSVFNNNLENIRNEIVQISATGGNLQHTIYMLAEDVVDQIEKRWDLIRSGQKDSLQEEKSSKPKRFADKMLSNYRNIGFIHLLFPNALILHVNREPMDTIFSSFKHDFSAGALDHTNDFEALAHTYRNYMDLIDHWDQVLPGRIKHIRYEDMVHDMPGMAKAIIKATGLPWNEDVLEFHKKKQAVNTLSTTQVRKGVYKHSIHSWKKYEKHLEPLVKLVGDRVHSKIKTTLPGFKEKDRVNN